MNNEDMLYVLTNDNFMNWVMKELGKHYYVSDANNNLEKEDLFFAKKLKTLFDLVSEYAENNHIYATEFMQYEMYYVYYNGSVFYVYERMNTYGCFSNNINKKELPYCINFDDVKKNKMESIINSDHGIFKDLKDEVVKLHKKGFSTEFIKELLNDLFNKMDEEEKGFVYKKK